MITKFIARRLAQQMLFKLGIKTAYTTPKYMWDPNLNNGQGGEVEL